MLRPIPISGLAVAFAVLFASACGADTPKPTEVELATTSSASPSDAPPSDAPPSPPPRHAAERSKPYPPAPANDCVSPPHGDPNDTAAAEALFTEARQLMSQARYSEACAKLEHSLRLDPASGTALNLAKCREQMGDTPGACTALAIAQPWIRCSDARAAYVREERAKLACP